MIEEGNMGQTRWGAEESATFCAKRIHFQMSRIPPLAPHHFSRDFQVIFLFQMTSSRIVRPEGAFVKRSLTCACGGTAPFFPGFSYEICDIRVIPLLCAMAYGVATISRLL